MCVRRWCSHFNSYWKEPLREFTQSQVKKYVVLPRNLVIISERRFNIKECFAYIYLDLSVLGLWFWNLLNAHVAWLVVSCSFIGMVAVEMIWSSLDLPRAFDFGSFHVPSLNYIQNFLPYPSSSLLCCTSLSMFTSRVYVHFRCSFSLHCAAHVQWIYGNTVTQMATLASVTVQKKGGIQRVLKAAGRLPQFSAIDLKAGLSNGVGIWRPSGKTPIADLHS